MSVSLSGWLRLVAPVSRARGRSSRPRPLPLMHFHRTGAPCSGLRRMDHDAAMGADAARMLQAELEVCVVSLMTSRAQIEIERMVRPSSPNLKPTRRSVVNVPPQSS
eukprot:1691444-Rhodomonas_salina.1